MAYRRKRNYRRKRTPWYRKKYSAITLAKKAYSGVKYIRGLVNSEMFDVVTTGNNYAITNTGGVVHLSNIAQDDGSTGRTGNSILAKSLFYRFVMKCHASATVSTVRVIFLWDTQQVADTSPAVSSILQSTDPLSALSLSVEGRFTIIKDYTFTLDNITKKSFAIKNFCSLNKHIRFNGSTGSDIQKNGLYLMCISDEATNTPTISYNCKLSYHDN